MGAVSRGCVVRCHYVRIGQPTIRNVIEVVTHGTIIPESAVSLLVAEIIHIVWNAIACCVFTGSEYVYMSHPSVSVLQWSQTRLWHSHPCHVHLNWMGVHYDFDHIEGKGKCTIQ